MKDTVNKLYGFIARLVSLLEDELDEIGSIKSKKALNVKKNITDTLGKLVALIIQLNKLKQEEICGEWTISKEDENIIKRFIEKYNSQNKLWGIKIMRQTEEFLEAILRDDFASFIAKVFSTINPGVNYHANWHIELIAQYLEAVRQRQIKRLIINMPPRALKSVCVSVAWPAWLLALSPSIRIIVASYSSVLSIKHSLDSRLVISSDWYKKLFPKTKISKIHNQKSKFLTTKNGFRFATSVGGSSTGEGGDFLIIDDPHNPTQINSLKMRNRVIDWFEQTFVTRLNDKNNGAIVLVMQRLHQDDLSAHLESSGNWEVLKIPVLASKNIEYNFGNFYKLYREGEVLDNIRDSREFLCNLEQEIGTRNYAAQFLQEPLSDNYNLLSQDNIHYFEKLPDKFEFFVHSWDTAIKISEKADYTVGTIWGVLENKYYLVQMIRKKFVYSHLRSEIERQIHKYMPKFVLIEDKASGQQLIQDLKL